MKIEQKIGNKTDKVHVCTYTAPFGIVPAEIDEIYPLSQHEITTPLDEETINYTAKQVASYITVMNYKRIILLQDVETWKEKIAAACRNSCHKKNVLLTIIKAKNPWNKQALNELTATIRNVLLRGTK